MKIKTYKKGVNFKTIFVGAIVAGLVLVPIAVNTTRAKYSTSETIPLINGRVKYTPYDFKIMAMYQADDNGNYQEIEEMPSSGYVINEEKSYCYTTDPDIHDTSVILKTNSSGNHEVGNLKKSSKCYLWFDEKIILAKDMIIANAESVSARNDFSIIYADSNTNLYKAEDDDGTSYYFAGAATNNYVKFGGYFWRIIRINGDETIRMIYDGTTARANGTSSADTQIGKSAFNSDSNNNNDNMYVGFMYKSNTVHGLETSSIIKDELDAWYINNLSSYTKFLDINAGFCGDRAAYTDYQGTTSGGGTGITTTYYGANIRLSRTKVPSLKCSNSSDLYTKSGASKGNKALTYPIGLITADEVSYAGGVMPLINSTYYLYTGQDYWTISPSVFESRAAKTICIYTSGNVGHAYVHATYGVRPVINLRADVTLTGLGTSSDPYLVS